MTFRERIFRAAALFVVGCGFEPGLVVACDDGVKNGAEVDVDCGGGCPNRCPDGGSCIAPSDCENLSCIDGVCQSARCDDGVRNGTEADADCGVSCDKPCADHKLCAEANDCASGVCTAGKCMPPTCGDGILSTDETDVDCGGSCLACDNGKACVTNDDCASRACVSGSCSLWVSAFGPIVPGIDGRAVDAQGNLFAVGTFSGSVSLGGASLDGTNNKTVFLAKYDPTGAHLWSKNVGPGFPGCAAVDGAGNLFFAGLTFGGNFGGDDFGMGLFVAKYSADGDYLWSRLYAGDVVAPAIAIADDGDVVLSGRFNGPTITFGGTVLTSSSVGTFTPYVVRLAAADGSVVWARTPTFISPPNGAGGVGRGIALDPAGDVVVVGQLVGPMVDFGCGIENASVNEEAFVVKFDGATGACKWARIDAPTQGMPGKRALGVAVDVSGNLIVAGSQNNTADTVWVDKLAGTDGSIMWSRPPIAGLQVEEAFRIALDAAGNPVVTGMYRGAAPNFGGDPLVNPAPNTYDVFVAKFASSDGAHLASQRYGGTGDDYAVGLERSVATNGMVLMGGFQGTVDFGTGELFADSPASMFFLSLGSLP